MCDHHIKAGFVYVLASDLQISFLRWQLGMVCQESDVSSTKKAILRHCQVIFHSEMSIFTNFYKLDKVLFSHCLADPLQTVTRLSSLHLKGTLKCSSIDLISLNNLYNALCISSVVFQKLFI